MVGVQAVCHAFFLFLLLIIPLNASIRNWEDVNAFLHEHALVKGCGSSTGRSSHGSSFLQITGYNETTGCPAPCPKCSNCQKCRPIRKCPEIPPCPKRFPPGYKYYSGLGCYKVHSVPLSWWDAKATCERERAHLIILNSKKEADLVKKLGKDRFPYIHVGLHDFTGSRNFTTVLGEPLSTTGYSKWDRGEPNNLNERCGSLRPGMGLNDIACSCKKAFICEYIAL